MSAPARLAQTSRLSSPGRGAFRGPTPPGRTRPRLAQPARYCSAIHESLRSADHPICTLAACAFVASAQLLEDDNGGRLADFPSSCLSPCDSFEALARVRLCRFPALPIFVRAPAHLHVDATCRTQDCSAANPEDTASAEAATLACICTDTARTALESCGNCISSNTADMAMSESGAVILQLAVSFSRGCGMSLAIDGASPSISSVLADGGSEYSSEREALSTATARDALVATSSDDAEQTGGARTTAASATADGDSVTREVSMTVSETDSSSAPTATASGDAGSGAASLAVGGLVGAVCTLLVAMSLI